MHCVLRVLRLRAAPSGTYASRVTACCTLLRVALVTLPLPFKTRDTVATDTPAAAATWRIVTGRSPSRCIRVFIVRREGKRFHESAQDCGSAYGRSRWRSLSLISLTLTATDDP
jgi:hypothetical protein